MSEAQRRRVSGLFDWKDSCSDAMSAARALYHGGQGGADGAVDRFEYEEIRATAGGDQGVDEYSKQHLLGAKTLGLFSSIVIVVNNIAGPGMLVLPRVYAEAGWVMPTVVLLLICVFSALASLFLVDTMARVPGNASFERRIEFVNIFEEFWGGKGKQIAQVFFIMNMMAQICSSIVSNAQVMDNFIVFLSPSSSVYALQVWPTIHWLSWTPPEDVLKLAQAASQRGGEMSIHQAANCHLKNVVPFQLEDGVVEDRILISSGYVLLAVTLIPMSLMNLDENILIQKISFYMLLFLSLEFLAQFYMQGLDTYEIPAFGDNYAHVWGSIVFNYAFLGIIPSWVNEKRPDVSVRFTVWFSTLASTVLYALVGVMGASAYARTQGNFLSTLSNVCSPRITRISAFLFAFGMIGLGIPFAAIVTRYNLLVGRLAGPRMSTFWSIYAPWLVSWAFYTGGLFNEIIAWSGDLAIGPINFVLPLLVALSALGVQNVVPSSWLPSRNHHLGMSTGSACLCSASVFDIDTHSFFLSERVCVQRRGLREGRTGGIFKTSMRLQCRSPRKAMRQTPSTKSAS